MTFLTELAEAAGLSTELRDPYCEKISDLLVRQKRKGVSWEEAWKQALKVPPGIGWGGLNGRRAGQEESPRHFMKRHMQAAYLNCAPPQRQNTITDAEWLRYMEAA